VTTPGVKMNLKLRRNLFLPSAITVFWYLSLFPGRLGADYVAAIRMIQNGISTDWWTASFFWFLKLTSFWGRSIFLASLVGLLVLVISVYWFVYSLPFSEKVLRRTFLFILSTPFIGVFGVTVSHDVFQAAGLLFLTGYELRMINKKQVSSLKYLTIFLSAVLCLSTIQIGPIIVLISLTLQIFRNHWRSSLALGALALAIIPISGIGIQTEFQKHHEFYPFLADLKCIAQHPEARITPTEWKYLLNFASDSAWKNQLSCDDTDSQVNTMNINFEGRKLDRVFLINYAKIVSRNPAITVMSHVQRSRGSLPPPFFQGPENQVELDTTKPIGLNTNIALQSGPELLHPSIDEPTMKIHIPILKPFEFAAQIPTFLINQASWFWGWGGLWLWPILIFFLLYVRPLTIMKIALGTYPLVLVHVAMFLIGPDSIGRYYMATIIAGLVILTAMILQGITDRRIYATKK